MPDKCMQLKNLLLKCQKQRLRCVLSGDVLLVCSILRPVQSGAASCAGFTGFSTSQSPLWIVATFSFLRIKLCAVSVCAQFRHRLKHPLSPCSLDFCRQVVTPVRGDVLLPAPHGAVNSMESVHSHLGPGDVEACWITFFFKQSSALSFHVTCVSYTVLCME